MAHRQPQGVHSRERPGAASVNNGQAWLLVRHALRALSQFLYEGLGPRYEVTAQLVDFADLDVPQRRPRLIVMGIRRDPGIRPPEIPSPYRGRHRTVGEALDDDPLPDDAPNHETGGDSPDVVQRLKAHSYAAESFSTKTMIIDVERGEVIDDLERFSVTRDGQRFAEIDFNFWGVTFADDNNRFYATLGTGDHRYLVEGDLRARTATVVRDGVECPSLSPDNRRIAFKKRVSKGIGPVTWRLLVLDLETLEETPLAETASIDDQAAWLDDRQVIYGLPSGRPGDSAADTWVVPADGSGTPQLFVPQAWSTVVVAR